MILVEIPGSITFDFQDLSKIVNFAKTNINSLFSEGGSDITSENIGRVFAGRVNAAKKIQDDGKKSTIIGFQHQNENLMRSSFLGILSPITGAMITADNASYFYTGV